MGTKIELPGGWKAQKRAPSLLSRIGTWGALAYFGLPNVDEAWLWWVRRAGLVLSGRLALLQNPTFLHWATWSLVACGVLWVVYVPARLVPIEVHERRKKLGMVTIGTVVTAFVVDAVPAPRIALEATASRIEIRAISDDQFSALAVVIPGLRVRNSSSDDVELTFSADLTPNDGSGVVSAVSDCTNPPEATLLAKLDSLRLPAPHLMTPVVIAEDADLEGSLCLWAGGRYPQDFRQQITLHMRDLRTDSLRSVQLPR